MFISEGGGGFAAYFAVAAIGAVAAVASPNLLMAYAGLAIISAAYRFLLKRRWGEAVSVKYYSFSLAADLLFGLGVLLYFGATGTFDMADAGHLVSVVNISGTAAYFKIALILLFVPLIARSCFVPAPLKGDGQIVLLLLFFRISALVILLKIAAPVATLWMADIAPMIFLAAGMAMTFGNLMMLRVEDMTGFTAHSIIAYAGYALAMFPLLSITGGGEHVAILVSLFFISIAHIGIFAVLKLISDEEEAGAPSVAGMAGEHPFAALLLAVLLLMLAGIPLSAGFLVRLMMLKGLAAGSHYSMLAVVAANFAVSCCAYLRPIFWMYGETAEKSMGTPYRQELCYTLTAVIAFCIISSFYLGVSPNSFIRWVGTW